MFLIDDILLAPGKALFMVFRELHNAAQQEIANEAETIRTALSELYLMLETGKVTEEEFDRLEKELLDHLDEIEACAAEESEEDEEEDEAEGGEEAEVNDEAGDRENEPLAVE